MPIWFSSCPSRLLSGQYRLLSCPSRLLSGPFRSSAGPSSSGAGFAGAGRTTFGFHNADHSAASRDQCLKHPAPYYTTRSAVELWAFLRDTLALVSNFDGLALPAGPVVHGASVPVRLLVVSTQRLILHPASHALPLTRACAPLTSLNVALEAGFTSFIARCTIHLLTHYIGASDRFSVFHILRSAGAALCDASRVRVGRT